MSTKAKVSEQLRLVNRQDLFDGLELDRETRVDEQVVTIPAVEGRTAIADAEGHLAHVRDTEGMKFERKRGFVGRLVHPWAEIPMHGNGRTNDCTRGLMILINVGVIESEVSSWTNKGPIGDWRAERGVGTWHEHCRRSTKRRLS